ncbi:MAG: assimilatory sulfite reductase (NADPH) flavoprotein subunit [Pseudomonadota bacterium]
MMQLPAAVNPLSADQAQQFESLLGSMTPLQQAWVSGYLAANAATAPAENPVAPPVAAAPFTILYGSQTGNAKHLAQDLADRAKGRGFETQLVDMADFKPAKIKNERFLAIVVSTYGEGEPPETAAKLHAFLGSKKAPRLENTKIAVLGIGDTSYEHFCKTAVDFEDRLTALGATIIAPRALLDVDYDDHAEDWIAGTINAFEPELKAKAPAGNVVPISPGITAKAPAQFSKKNPFSAEVLAVQKITGRDSTRDTRHVEISLDGSGLQYQAGDALGVYFHNNSSEVDHILDLLQVEGSEHIEGREKTLRDTLIEDLELTQSYPGFVTAFATATGNAILQELAKDAAELRAYLQDRQIFDIIREHPAPISADALVGALRKMQPRLYSIASSQAEVEEEVHLTVGVVEYDAFDRNHLGGASGYLGRRLEEGDKIRVFVEQNNHFRLPDNPETPVIMIGPGTGIAPFRAFLQDRDAAEADGKNWLFFGNPHFTQDFLYQVELQDWLKSGLLSKLSVAFSRDQKEKIYVQHRIREAGAEFWAWLESGAHIYVCGDQERMAKDVHAALIDVVQSHGGKSADEAEAYVEALRDAKRYQRDVY